MQSRKNIRLEGEIANLQDQLKAQSIEQTKLMGTVILLWDKLDTITANLAPAEDLGTPVLVPKDFNS